VRLRCAHVEAAAQHTAPSRAGASTDDLLERLNALAADPEARAAARTAAAMGGTRETVAAAFLGTALANGSISADAVEPELRASAFSAAVSTLPSIDRGLELLVELTGAESVSAWLEGRCIAEVGSRDGTHVFEIARGSSLVLDGDRDARPFARRLARGLAPLVEQARLTERLVDQERMTVETGSRLFTRLGYDLHDGPLQEIAALTAELRLLRAESTEASPEALSLRLDDALAMLSAIEREVRGLAGAMDANSLVSRPFAELLGDETAEAAANGVDVRAEVNGDLDGCTPSQRIALLRVVRESLSNVARHSGADSASVVVSADETELSAEVVDRGRGFDVEAARDGGRLGLLGMGERIRLLDGTLELESRPGGPTRVRATIPRWRPTET
jgi:signal transduction histidine kinase